MHPLLALLRICAGLSGSRVWRLRSKYPVLQTSLLGMILRIWSGWWELGTQGLTLGLWNNISVGEEVKLQGCSYITDSYNVTPTIWNDTYEHTMHIHLISTSSHTFKTHFKNLQTSFNTTAWGDWRWISTTFYQSCSTIPGRFWNVWSWSPRGFPEVTSKTTAVSWFLKLLVLAKASWISTKNGLMWFI